LSHGAAIEALTDASKESGLEVTQSMFMV
jgi:hypothetical protein